MEKDERKVVYGIRGKLVSAVAMLLVACIMVVSSTYAWFTLSTAPEVKGISTAVGANGALEMLLTSFDSSTGDIFSGDGLQTGVTDVPTRNKYWGNLVDLSSNTEYGSNLITLYPSMLDLTLTGGSVPVTGPVLSTPEYGADGRLDAVERNAVYGKYDGTAFYPVNDNDYGFRVLGVASGMTERELAYRNALSNIKVNMGLAKNSAAASIENNGSTLADIAVIKAMLDSPKFTQAQIDSISAMIRELKVALDSVEEAYIQSILALAASAAVQDEAGYTAISNSINGLTRVSGSSTDLDGIISNLETVGVSLPANLSAGIDAYKASLANVVAAEGLIPTSGTSGDTNSPYLWEDFDDALNKLVNINTIEVNGSSTIDKDKIAGDVFAGRGITVTMPTGSGVYADIADQCGDYSAGIKISGKELGINESAPATMNTKTDMTTAAKGGYVYLDAAHNAASAAGTPDTSGTAKPLTEFYGYVIDLSFRTNAAQSKLLLQAEGVDRIYEDNNNDNTMGSGSTMTFKTVDPSFTTDNMRNLMGNIRIVFFDTKTGTIYAQARLETSEDETQTTADGIVAEMYIPLTVDAYKYTITEGQTSTDYIVFRTETTTGEGDSAVTTYTYYSDYEKTKLVTLPAGVSDQDVVATTTEIKSYEIADLNQNQAKYVSALVYLDGTTITNADVAASAAASMTGKVNFQFASSATLVPMEYSDLHITDQVPTITKDVTIEADGTDKTIVLSGQNATTFVFDGTAPTGLSISGTNLTVTKDAVARDYIILGKASADADAETLVKIKLTVVNNYVAP